MSLFKVSVVICTYNRSQILKQCIKSLVNQTIDKKFYEVIIVNNNSTDDTQKIAEEFVKICSNFHVVIEISQGLSYARNRGWYEAKGEYVAYIDDDAKAYPDWLEKIIFFLSNNPDIQAFGGPYARYSLEKIPEWLPENYGTQSLGEVERPIDVRKEWISGTNMIFRRSLLEQTEGFDVSMGMKGKKISYGEETYLLIKINDLNYPIYYCPDIKVEHLILPYKMSLFWNFKSYFKIGYAAEEVLSFKLSLWFCIKSLFSLLKSILIFLTIKEKYIKTKAFKAFCPFFHRLGMSWAYLNSMIKKLGKIKI